MGNNRDQKQAKRFVDYWTFKNTYDEIINLIKSLSTNIFKVDTINESTPGSGVTIEGVRILDGLIAPGSIPPVAYTNISASGETADAAAPLSYGFNYINNASAGQRGVYLPIDIQEQDVYIINSTTTPIYVYGENAASSILKLDTKDFVADTTYLVLKQNESVKFFRVGTRWIGESFNGVKNKPLVYTALLSQSGTNAPTVTVLENSIGNIVWGYLASGVYTATLTGAFIESKTVAFISGTLGWGSSAILGSGTGFYRISDDALGLQVLNGVGAAENGLITGFPVEIRIYN